MPSVRYAPERRSCAVKVVHVYLNYEQLTLVVADGSAVGDGAHAVLVATAASVTSHASEIVTHTSGSGYSRPVT
jgi:hypothetical protein